MLLQQTLHKFHPNYFVPSFNWEGQTGWLRYVDLFIETCSNHFDISVCITNTMHTIQWMSTIRNKQIPIVNSYPFYVHTICICFVNQVWAESRDPFFAYKEIKWKITRGNTNKKDFPPSDIHLKILSNNTYSHTHIRIFSEFMIIAISWLHFVRIICKIVRKWMHNVYDFSIVCAKENTKCFLFDQKQQQSSE